MDGYDKNEELENGGEIAREEIFSKVVRAGKRTYFLDVKATRRNDYYLTITESKKRFNRDGRHYFEKHKIFLYKEDFEKFTENLEEVISFIKKNVPEQEPLEKVEVGAEVSAELETVKAEGYSSDVEFDDLGDIKE
ncbi:MAG TPA: DNA-binding protein [Bacteroidales bacterium]|nr:DNA-binding protein [Bacteroidales bacterium]